MANVKNILWNAGVRQSNLRQFRPWYQLSWQLRRDNSLVEEAGFAIIFFGQMRQQHLVGGKIDQMGQEPCILGELILPAFVQYILMSMKKPEDGLLLCNAPAPGFSIT